MNPIAVATYKAAAPATTTPPEAMAAMAPALRPESEVVVVVHVLVFVLVANSLAKFTSVGVGSATQRR